MRSFLPIIKYTDDYHRDLEGCISFPGFYYSKHLFHIHNGSLEDIFSGALNSNIYETEKGLSSNKLYQVFQRRKANGN